MRRKPKSKMMSVSGKSPTVGWRPRPDHNRRMWPLMEKTAAAARRRGNPKGHDASKNSRTFKAKEDLRRSRPRMPRNTCCELAIDCCFWALYFWSANCPRLHEAANICCLASKSPKFTCYLFVAVLTHQSLSFSGPECCLPGSRADMCEVDSCVCESKYTCLRLHKI